MWTAFVGVLAGLINMMYGVTGSLGYPSYGMAIILFTVALRVLMFPLNLLQAKSSKSMSLLQPRLQQLQQQYKTSPDILNRETQALYRKYNVNPLAGCFPLLIQMPVLFALFSALRNFQYTGAGVSFFWIPNLSEPDPTGIVLPVIVGLSSFLQSKLTAATQPQAGEQAKMMNMVMLYAMPVMLGWMTRGFAAGLAIYWSIFNTLGFLMQIAINGIVNRSHESMIAKMEADETRAASEAKAEKAAEKAEEDTRREETKRKKETDRRRTADQKKVKLNRGRNKGIEKQKGQELNFDD